MSKELTKHSEEILARKNMDYLMGVFNWPELIKNIHEEIINLSLTHVTPKHYYKGWQNIFTKNGGVRNSPFWWHEFTLITNAIIDKIDSPKPNKEISLHGILKNRSLPILDKLNFGCYGNQDTIIPKFFEPSYKQRLPNIKFITFKDWSEGWEAFQANKIQVALRDFPTTVAYNSLLKVDSPLFFWPFFSFRGYGIFIRIASLKRFCKKYGIQIQKHSFKQLSPGERTRFLEEQNFIVEGNTDFEWVLKKFCSNNGCNLQAIENKFTYKNTKQAKLEFVDNKEYSVYCTNPAHIIDLGRRREFELIPQNVNLDHKNFNGLICKEEYYMENKPIIERLIKTWFLDIIPFKNEIKTLSLPPSHRPEEYSPSYTIENLTREISNMTDSEIEVDNLPILYEHSNFFYEDPNVAFDEFYNKVLKDKVAINNYAEIALIQLKGHTQDIEKIKKEIAIIRDNMIKL